LWDAEHKLLSRERTRDIALRMSTVAEPRSTCGQEVCIIYVALPFFFMEFSAGERCWHFAASSNSEYDAESVGIGRSP